ncbi:MAG: glycosyltransferase family 4 protein [Anaerolineales bacterium]|nr:glycosyltransferase family 4 protein [Anaerolineales bacterium]
MKVLLIAPDLFGPPGGIARYAQMVCLSLVKAGHTVEAVVLADPSNTHVPTTFDTPTLNYHPCHGNRLAFVQKSIEMALKIKPALILVGHVNFSPLGYGLAKLIGAKWATFIYGIDVWQPLPWHRRLAVRKSDQIISISKFTAQQAAQNNNLGKKGDVQILHNCLAPSFEVAARPERQKPPRMNLLTVARTTLAERYKGHDYVIRAMAIMRTRFPQLVYHIVGDGDWQPDLRKLADELGVSENVVFHGRVSDEALLQHYIDATVFVMPSQCEGFGFVFIEAMAHGTPAIGGNLDATPEVIMDGVTGCLVDPTSVNAIATAISYLLENPAQCEQMGINGQQHVQEKFSFDRFQQNLLKIIDRFVVDGR